MKNIQSNLMFMTLEEKWDFLYQILYSDNKYEMKIK